MFVDALTRGSIQGFFWHDASHRVNGDCLTLVLTYSGGKKTFKKPSELGRLGQYYHHSRRRRCY